MTNRNLSVKQYLLWGVALGSVGLLASATATAVSVGATFAKKAVTPASRVRQPVRVLSVTQRADAGGEPDSVQLNRGEDVGLPGDQYSFVFNQGRGHAQLGRILREDARSITRELVKIDEGALLPGTRGRITGWWYHGPEDLGLPWQNECIPTELGPMPAWSIGSERTDSDHWAIHVHGRGARRQECLRGVRPAARAGLHNLVVSYRNDPDAPRSSDGKYSFGIEEARDVVAAVRWARERGARRITLFGYSMGATTSLLAAEHPEVRPHVAGIVLDSPALDWREVLLHHARLSRVPAVATRIGLALLRGGSRLVGVARPIPLGVLTPERFAANLTAHTLVHSSPGDSFVPDAPVARFAAARPDLVTWRRQPAGEHVRLWNVDPLAWEAATQQFLNRVRVDC